jgi:c-di-GMP-binding flagellar brake protein YcgR
MFIEPKVVEHLRQLQKNKTRVVLSAKGMDISFQTRLLACQPDRLLVQNTIPYALIASFLKAKPFYLLSPQHRFTCENIESDGVNIVFRPVGYDKIAETRVAERLPFEREDRVFCEMKNPFDGETKLSFPVLDMSAGGLSFWTPRLSKLFVPNLILSPLHVLIENEMYDKGQARVIYARKTIDLKGRMGLQVGLEIQRQGDD